MKKHFFLTGLPSIGKTTALLRILQPLNKKTAGFHTEEIRLHTQRVGLTLIASDRSAFRVAACGKNIQDPPYVLDAEMLECGVRRAFREADEAAVIYADLVGTLYCRSPYFVEMLREFLHSHTVIGTIARRGHALVEEIHRRNDCEILEITADNRDSIPTTVLEQINS